MHVEAQVSNRCLPLSPPSYILRSDLSLNLALTSQTSQAASPRAPPVSTSPGIGLYKPQYLALKTNKRTWVLRIRLRSSCWYSKLFTHGAISPVLCPLHVDNSSMQIHTPLILTVPQVAAPTLLCPLGLLASCLCSQSRSRVKGKLT